MEFLNGENLEFFGQLILATLLGCLIGLERRLAGKKAGMRTFALVSLGAALFSIVSKYAFRDFWGLPGFDPSRIASQIVVGIGFIGAGIIIFHKSSIKGLTTAAGLWVSAAIGMAVGFKMYSIALVSTVLIISILFLLWHLEVKLINKDFITNKEEEEDED